MVTPAQCPLAGGEEPERTLAHVRELVGHDRVQPVLVEGELDEAALGRLEVERLGAALAVVGPQEVGALLVDGVEDRADDVERRVLRSARVEHPGPERSSTPPRWGVGVLVDVAVEDHGVPVVGLHLAEVAGLAVGAEVVLGLHEDELVVDRGQVGRVDDDGAEHAVADVVQRRRRAAVVHEDPGVLGLELVHERLARGDGAHLVVPGHPAGVEVDRVADLALVGERDGEDVADLAAQDRAGHLARRRSTPPGSRRERPR
jgi:hypothetical protein